MSEPIEIMLNPDKERREKALKSMARTGYLSVWEGAVRSSKTVIALMAFAIYVTRSPETSFLISGRTVGTIEKNCIFEDYGLLNLLPGSEYRKVGESRAITFFARQGDRIVEKHIYVLGAADIRAYMALRGNSYGGWMADEVNMHDKEFVIEALKRTAVSTDRRHFWTLNPDNPHHWVYKEFLDYYDSLDKEQRKALGGYHWWHFTPEDNPAMTPEMLKALELQYPRGSYLYDRYILGLRVMAEGLIYPKVNASMFRPEEDMVGTDVRYCAIDFGATHATVMVFGGIYKGNKKDWRIVAEYYDQGSDKTTYDHYKGFLDVCQRIGADPSRMIIAIDPAAKVLRQEFLQHGLTVIKAKNDVLPGIEYTRALLYSGALLFSDSCDDMLPEFASYSWDPKASERGEEKPIKQNDDRMDAVRYFAWTHIKPILGMIT